jgi:hypothetical protein
MALPPPLSRSPAPVARVVVVVEVAAPTSDGTTGPAGAAGAPVAPSLGCGGALGFPGASSQRNGTVTGERRGGVSGGPDGHAATPVSPRSATRLARDRARPRNCAGGSGRDGGGGGFLAVVPMLVAVLVSCASTQAPG